MKDSGIKVNINFRILPFGHTYIEIKGSEGMRQKRLERPIIYGEPKITNQQAVEISFKGKEYGLPKDTGGVV